MIVKAFFRALSASAFAFILSAHAAFPDRPITLVVPFAAGGPTDTLARLIGDEMARALGQPVIIENKAGGNAIIGTQQVARARRDGYTLLVATPATMVMNPLLRNDLPYSPERDLDALELINVNPLIIVTSASSRYKTLEEFVIAAKAEPGKLSYASVGIGSAYQLAMEYLQELAGIKLNHIPYKGSAIALPDVIGGRVDAMPETPTASLPHIENGKLRPLSISSAQRSSRLPNVPTVAEKYPGYEALVWSAVVAPKGLPDDVRSALKSAIGKALASPKYLHQMKETGTDPAPPRSSAELEKFMQTERAKWRKVIEQANISLQ